MREDKTLKRLIRIISDGEKNRIDLDQFKKWSEFKEEWSEKDKAYWENLLKRVSNDSECKRALSISLSYEEKTWIINVLNKAIDYGIF